MQVDVETSHILTS